MKIKEDRILLSFTAGEALSEGNVVYVSSANTVSKATTSNTYKLIGVVDADASSGESVDIVVLGKKSVVADGTIAVGDRVVAATTAGRVVSENSIPTHTHTATVTDTGHTHTATVTDGGHTHTATVTDGGHTHTQADLSVASVTALSNDLGHDGAGGLETTSAATTITTPDTDSATTGVTVANSSDTTGATVANSSDTTGVTVANSNDNAGEHGRVLGKALGSATAGSSVIIMVYLL